MRKYLSLTKTMIKSGLSINDGKTRKGYRVLLNLIVLAALFPSLLLLYYVVDQTLPMFHQLDQSVSLMGGILFLNCSLIFIFSLFIIPAVFYFSNDIDILLSLPLKGEQIIAAKFTVCVIYEYLFSFAILIPSAAAYIHVNGFSFSLCLFTVLTALLIPIFPLVLSTAFTVLIMRFMPYFKNKDHFNFISGILLVAVGVGISISVNSISPQEQAEIIQLFVSGNNSFLTFFIKLFPIIPYFSYAIVQGSIIDFLIGVAICIISLMVLLGLGKLWYFKGAIGNSETSGSQKRLEELSAKEIHQTNKTIAYLKKEWRLLYRTPAFATNCLGSTLLFPILLLLMGMLNQDQRLLLSMISSAQDAANFPYYVVLIGLGIGLFIGVVNSISATAVSREGTNYIVMKYLPFSFRKQIQAKALLGIIIGIMGNLFIVIVLAFLLDFAWYYYGLLFICMSITTIFANELCIMIDMFKPKLIWEQEVSAVKQNFRAFLGQMIMLGLCGLIIFISIFMPGEYIMLSAIFLLLLCIAAVIISCFVCNQLAEKAISGL